MASAATRRIVWLAALVLATLSHAARAQNLDRIGVPGPLAFAGTSYALAWSSHPQPTYYKQEYLPAGQSIDRYQRMLMVEVLDGGTVAGAASAQVRTIKARKGKDPLANVDAVKNSQRGEIIVDFLLGGRDAQGAEIAEWNAYRYVPFKTANGHAGVMLFAISHRA